MIWVVDAVLADVDLPNSHVCLSKSNRTWRRPCRLGPSSSDKFTSREIGPEASFCSSTVSPKKPLATKRATTSSKIGPITADLIRANRILASSPALFRWFSVASARSRSVFSCRSALSSLSYAISASRASKILHGRLNVTINPWVANHSLVQERSPFRKWPFPPTGTKSTCRDGLRWSKSDSDLWPPVRRILRERDQGFESLYPSKRLLAGRHCRLAEPGRPT